MTPIDDIKSKIDIVEFIREYLPEIKKSGANWKARCPFHNEKTPSFMVSQEKQIWHCFGCGEGGDIFGFLQKIENIEFPEALRILADKAGVKLTHQDPKMTNLKTRLLDLHELAADFYHRMLYSPQGRLALNYLTEERKLTQETIKDFKLGFAPNDWRQLANFLKSKGYNSHELRESGLVVEKNVYASNTTQTVTYDRFRGRLMFPIIDHNGNAVAFTGRALSKDFAGGKYVNSPQTLIYNKSAVLYGLDKAKNFIKEKNSAVIVEGNMDVIASYQAGVREVVASSGTALTEDQLNILRRYTETLIFSFDQDAAGEMALTRALGLALAKGFNLKVIVIDKSIAKDPDELVKKDPILWQQAVDAAQPFMDYLFEHTFKNHNPEKLEEKRRIAKTLLYWLNLVLDVVVKDYYLKKLAAGISVDERTLRSALSPVPGKSIISDQELKPTGDRFILLNERLLTLLCAYPKGIEIVSAESELAEILQQTYRDLYKQIVIYYNNKNEIIYSELKEEVLAQDPALSKTLEVVMIKQEEFSDWEEEDLVKELTTILREIRRQHLISELKKVSQDIQQTEANGDIEHLKTLMEKFSDLTTEITLRQ